MGHQQPSLFLWRPRRQSAALDFVPGLPAPGAFLHIGTRGRPNWGKLLGTPGGAKQVLRRQRPRPPWHGYGPFPGTLTTLMRTFMCTFQGCADGSKELADSLSFVRGGTGPSLRREVVAPGRGRRETGLSLASLVNRRLLPSTPEIRGQLVFVLRV